MSTYPEVVKAILTNNSLSEDEKSILISKMMEEFQENYPELHNHATKNDIKELELQIEEVKKDINELKVELQKVRNEGKDSELKLTKEIEKVRLDLTKDIKELDVKISNTKVEIIKWVAGMMIGQTFVIAGIVAGIFKFFMH